MDSLFSSSSSKWGLVVNQDTIYGVIVSHVGRYTPLPDSRRPPRGVSEYAGPPLDGAEANDCHFLPL